MKTNTNAPDYKGYRFPPELSSHAVWLYFRFSLIFRDVEELLAERGIVVTSETVRQWCLKCGQSYCTDYLVHPFKNKRFETEKDLFSLLANTGRLVYNPKSSTAYSCTNDDTLMSWRSF